MIDAAGGSVLAGALAGLQHSGVATTCGLAAGTEYPGNVLPFILRGISLVGIDSVRTPVSRREAAWRCLARHLRPALLDTLTRTVPLSHAQEAAAELLAGNGTGRIVVDAAQRD